MRMLIKSVIVNIPTRENEKIYRHFSSKISNDRMWRDNFEQWHGDFMYILDLLTTLIENLYLNAKRL